MELLYSSFILLTIILLLLKNESERKGRADQFNQFIFLKMVDTVEELYFKGHISKKTRYPVFTTTKKKINILTMYKNFNSFLFYFYLN
jgi:hypothetical protein